MATTTDPVEPVTAPPEPTQLATPTELSPPKQSNFFVGFLVVIAILGIIAALIVNFTGDSQPRTQAPASQIARGLGYGSAVKPGDVGSANDSAASSDTTEPAATPGDAISRAPANLVTADPQGWLQIWFNNLKQAYVTHDASLLANSYIKGSGGMKTEQEALAGFTGEPGAITIQQASVNMADAEGLSIILDFTATLTDGTIKSGHIDLDNSEGPWKATDIYWN